MKLHQPLLSAAAAVVLALTVSGCGGDAEAGAGGSQGSEVKELRYQGWANTVTLPELAEDLGYLGDVKLKWVGNTTSGPQDIQSAATGQTDFGGAFAGAVVKLIEAGAPVKAVVNYYGQDEETFNGFYVKEDSSIRSARDFIGKKIAVNTLGAHADAVISTYLRKSGLSADEAKQVQLVPLPPNDTEEAIRRGQVDAGSLGGVLQDKALAAGGLRSVFSDTEFFGTFAGGPYVLSNDFIARNPNTTRTFATGVAKAIDWAGKTPREEVIARFTRIVKERGRNESTEALQYWKSAGVPDAGAIKDEDFTRWAEWLTSSGIVTKDLTPANYYTNEFNELAGKARP
ncbi:ABC transporter substrate-binding protein [Pseudarthrobacter sp. J75]|uniref:ABC transporter substrate-binding protein n=1 Tax=unclassified Pseudarthrobacter TaxID=2647000 RepID=UPI002E8225D5|nr:MULTISPECIES: ABC transporter substrate-binding protein [unclassified Pseudarthrobacter]MEE2521101.1 ABC transporter substrate-binding protein [Pseudarthrobacter sp. J47]MEE2528331.1 ABC transporter substrate-binding protein [Pseudarthrobacter sp. J75]